MMQLNVSYIFDDDQSRVMGLRGRKLGKGCCALFVYDSPAYPKFWMKDVPTDLYLSVVVDGTCVESHFMKRNTTRPHSVSHRTMCAIESRDEVPVGAKVDIRGGRVVVS